MPDAVAMGVAVAVGVGTLLPVWVVGTPPFPSPPLVLAASCYWRVLTWLVRVVLEVAREELMTISFLRTAFSLVAALARLLGCCAWLTVTHAIAKQQITARPTSYTTANPKSDNQPIE
jgi:hypothetical protein